VSSVSFKLGNQYAVVNVLQLSNEGEHEYLYFIYINCINGSNLGTSWESISLRLCPTPGTPRRCETVRDTCARATEYRFRM